MLSCMLNEYLYRFEAIIFDLDGVILDSGALKIECMREALNEFDDNIVGSFLKVFREQFGKNRVYHFKNFYNNYLNKIEGFDDFYNLYASRYANLLKIRYPDVDLCEYADEIIQNLASQSFNLFVATGTATEEAELVLTKKGLRPYFKNIFGSPCEKAKAIDLILQQTKVSSDKAILIGDAAHDRDSAFANQIKFLFVEKYSFVSKAELSRNFHQPFSIVSSLNPLNRIQNTAEH